MEGCSLFTGNSNSQAVTGGKSLLSDRPALHRHLQAPARARNTAGSSYPAENTLERAACLAQPSQQIQMHDRKPDITERQQPQRTGSVEAEQETAEGPALRGAEVFCRTGVRHPPEGIFCQPTPAPSHLSGAEHLLSEQRQGLAIKCSLTPCTRVCAKQMLWSPPSSPSGIKGRCRQEQLNANLPLPPGHEGMGDSVSELKNRLYGTAAHSSLAAMPGNNNLYVDNHGRRGKTPLKQCPTELPALHAGCSPSSCQTACSPCSRDLSPAAAKGHIHTPVTRGRAAQGQKKPHVCGCPRLHAALRRRQPNTALRCTGDVGQPGCTAGAEGGYCVNRLHHSLWDEAPPAFEWRRKTGDSSALLPGLGTPAHWEPVTSSSLNTFSS